MTERERGSSAASRVELRPGISIPRIVVGCWQLSEGHGKEFPRPEALERILELAEAGYDTFDGADIYTGVEDLLGDARRHVRERASGVRLRIHTKLVPDLRALRGLRRSDVVEIVDRSLRRLECDALDLVQFHWWDFSIPGWVEAAGWLGELREEGKVREIGVTNFDAGRLRVLLDAGVPVVSNQLQYSLLDRRPAGPLTELCRERGVSLLAYGALAGGLLTDRWLGRADPGFDPGDRSLVKYRLIVDEAGGWDALQNMLDAARAVGDRHGVGIAEVASRWTLDREGVAALVTGLSRRSRLDQYRATLSLRLDREDHDRLERALADLRPVPGEVYGLEREPGGRHAAIMKTDLNRDG